MVETPFVKSSKSENETYTEEQKKQLMINSKAMNVLYYALSPRKFNCISQCTITYELWKTLQVTYEETNKVKSSKIILLTQEFERFEMQEKESIKEMYTRFTNIVNNLMALGKNCVKELEGRVPFLYLEDIHMRFMKNYGKVAHSALAYSMNDEFSRVLHQQMEYYSSNPSAVTLSRVRGEVSEIQSVMVDNIEKILDRGNRLELLVDKTATMQDGSFHFRKQSRRLRRALWMKNVKLLGLLTCAIVLILYLIIAACCGGLTLPSCRS